ncbi:hypothetical protein TNCV_195171 [Trichonephila clavipes]|uniref:Uncharacterized protein n=1 Tax=Trichonephila clavipes TaxID=2585209 RepID=A0A8X6WI61_TRICX|nr:hypothetical protein TNCV_195171 [Trichonephila clavipes]
MRSRFRDLGGLVEGLLRLIHVLRHVACRWLRTADEKCAGTSSCIDQYSIQQLRKKWEIFIRIYFFSRITEFRIPVIVCPLPSSGSSSTRRLLLSRFPSTKRGPRLLNGQGLGSSLACHEFEPSTTKDPPCRGALYVKFVGS